MRINLHLSPTRKGRVFAMALLPFMLGLSAALSAPHAKRYVCTPCGLPCDSKFFDGPGTCPSCGMPIIDEEEAKATSATPESLKKIAILLFDGVEIIDFSGPYEVFGAAGFDVYTVAKSTEPVTTAMGLTVTPKYSFDDAPTPDVLVVPGGGVNAMQHDSSALRWIAAQTARILHTMSVCNGSFILASAGLLDGLSATTTNGNIPRLRQEFPKIHVVDDERYVDNGKIITTAGLSAGIDGALHVVELLMGKGYAEQVALIEEYDWRPDAAFVRAVLADQMIPEMNLRGEHGTWDLVSTEGSKDRWKRIYHGRSDESAQELRESIEGALAKNGNWRKEGATAGGESRWSFKGKDGAAWNGILTVRETSLGSHKYEVTVSVAKAG